MASMREAGWEAFRQGNIEEAIRLLTDACRADPSDFEAHLNLGAVYGQAGRHVEAIAALIAAVHLQPANAMARYNLGVAMEKAGHISQAIEAFHQAVMLDRGYTRAIEAARRLEGDSQSQSTEQVVRFEAAGLQAAGSQAADSQAEGSQTAGSQTADSQAAGSQAAGLQAAGDKPPPYNAPDTSPGSLITEAAVALPTNMSPIALPPTEAPAPLLPFDFALPPEQGFTAAAPMYQESGPGTPQGPVTIGSAVGMAPAGALYGAPSHVSTTQPMETPGFAATGTLGKSALPSHGLLSEYTASPNAPNGPSAVLKPYSPNMPPANFEDEMDIPKAIRDFGRILVTPDRFFREQAGKNGLMSPMLMVGIYLVLSLIEVMIRSGAQGIATLVLGIVFSPISLAMIGVQMLVMYLISALVVHFLGWMFGNRQDYSVSVRACVYADAPRFVLMLFSSLYVAFIAVPAIMAHPITTDELEQAMGLPSGMLAGTQRGGTVFGPTGASPSIIVASKHGTNPSGSTSTTSNGSSKPSAGSAPSKKGKNTAKSTPTTAAPQFSPFMIVGLAELIWRRFGGMVIVGLSAWAIGWLWSSVLLALAIHRLQQIPAAAAAGIVVLIYSIALLLLFVIGLALRGPFTHLIQFFLQSKGMGGVGGTSL